MEKAGAPCMAALCRSSSNFWPLPGSEAPSGSGAASQSHFGQTPEAAPDRVEAEQTAALASSTTALASASNRALSA